VLAGSIAIAGMRDRLRDLGDRPPSAVLWPACASGRRVLGGLFGCCPGRRWRQLEAGRRAPDNRRRRYLVLGWFFVIAGTFDTVRGYVTADGDVSVEDVDEDQEML
jgi:hypothetical protein